jgi:hypothetical protein
VPKNARQTESNQTYTSHQATKERKKERKHAPSTIADLPKKKTHLEQTSFELSDPAKNTDRVV